MAQDRNGFGSPCQAGIGFARCPALLDILADSLTIQCMDEKEVFRRKLFEAIGRKIAAARKGRHPRLSQAKLALEAGVTRSAVSAIEAGHQGVAVQTLCLLAIALGVAPGNLLPDYEELLRLKQKPENAPAESLVEEYLEHHG